MSSGEGGDVGNAVLTGMEGGMEGMDASSPSTSLPGPRTTRGGTRGVGRGCGRGRGRGSGVEGVQPSVAERYDQADEDHDCDAEEVNMRVDVADWAMVLQTLGIIECGETNSALKHATIEGLMEKKGLESG